MKKRKKKKNRTKKWQKHLINKQSYCYNVNIYLFINNFVSILDLSCDIQQVRSFK